MFQNRRWKLLQYSLEQRTLAGSLYAWLCNMLAPPCTYLARPLLRSVEVRDGFLEVEFKHMPGKLFVFKDLPLIVLYQIVEEQRYSWNWHQYLIPQTSLSPDDVVFDCGCAEGLFPFLNQAHAKKFVCFEPLPEFLSGLNRTFAGNPRVVIVPEALGDQVQTAYLQKIGIASRIVMEPTPTPVAITTIDHYCESTATPLNYLKADVEGYELHMLRGAANSIRKYRPKIAITTYHACSHAEEISAFLRELVPDYQILIKGIEATNGAPVLLHAW